jgi:predicted RNA-binding Zn-ribbon protein involved in translation (DUF1610 family)
MEYNCPNCGSVCYKTFRTDNVVILYEISLYCEKCGFVTIERD